MNDIDVRAGHLSKRCQMMNAFRLNARWPRGLVPFGARFAFAQEALLVLCDQLRILTVSCDDDTEIAGQLQRLIQFAVVDAKCALVREKTLEGRRSVSHDP